MTLPVQYQPRNVGQFHCFYVNTNLEFVVNHILLLLITSEYNSDSWKLPVPFIFHRL